MLNLFLITKKRIMNKYKSYIIFIIFLFTLNSCGTFTEGMVGSKRSKTSDEFLVHKKKPLVVPPDFETMPSPKYFEEKKKGDKITKAEGLKTIEDLLNINNKNDENFKETNDESLQQSIIKKIKQN